MRAAGRADLAGRGRMAELTQRRGSAGLCRPPTWADSGLQAVMLLMLADATAAPARTPLCSKAELFSENMNRVALEGGGRGSHLAPGRFEDSGCLVVEGSPSVPRIASSRPSRRRVPCRARQKQAKARRVVHVRF